MPWNIPSARGDFPVLCPCHIALGLFKSLLFNYQKIETSMTPELSKFSLSFQDPFILSTYLLFLQENLSVRLQSRPENGSATDDVLRRWPNLGEQKNSTR